MSLYLHLHHHHVVVIIHIILIVTKGVHRLTMTGAISGRALPAPPPLFHQRLQLAMTMMVGARLARCRRPRSLLLTLDRLAGAPLRQRVVPVRLAILVGVAQRLLHNSNA